MPFANSLTRTLPDLPQEEIFWRLHFTLALMHYTITDLRRLDAISGGICDLGDTDALIARMVGFAVAGFEAPALAAAVPRILSGRRANENGRPKPPISVRYPERPIIPRIQTARRLSAELLPRRGSRTTSKETFWPSWRLPRPARSTAEI